MTGEIFEVSDVSFIWTVPYINKYYTGKMQNKIYSPSFTCEGRVWKFHRYDFQDKLYFCIYLWNPYADSPPPSTHTYKFAIERPGFFCYASPLITDEFDYDKCFGCSQEIPEFSLSEATEIDPNAVMHIQVTFSSIAESCQHQPGSNSAIISGGTSKEEVKTYPNLQQPNVPPANPGRSNPANSSSGTSKGGVKTYPNLHKWNVLPANPGPSNSAGASFRTSEVETQDCSNDQQPTSSSLDSHGSNQKEDSSRTSGTQKRLNFH